MANGTAITTCSRSCCSASCGPRWDPSRWPNSSARATGWLAGQGLFDEALRHALARADLDLAAQLMESGFCAVLNREDRATLERWLRLLPEDFVKRRPWLLLMQAFAFQFSWQLSAAWKLLDQIVALLDAGGGAAAHGGDVHDLPALRGPIALLRGQEAFTAAAQADRAIACCEEALALLPAQWRFAHGQRIRLLGYGHARRRPCRRRATHPARRV